MTDTVSKEQRRKNMQAIHSRSNLEDRITKALWKRGLRFRKNVKTLMGKPDIAIKKYRVVIFIDSCFWHGCELHGNTPKSNTEYWREKLFRNKKRDEEVNQYYQDNNWSIIRVWEHEIKEDFEGAVDRIIKHVEKQKQEVR